MEGNKNIYKKLFEVKKAGIKLQRDTEAFNYKYATLSQIQEKLSHILEEQKLVVVHYVKDLSMYTEIRDIENPEEKVESSIRMADWTKPQDKGSEVTYYRRYNLLSLLDLEIEEDDDANKAQKSKPKVEKKWYNDTKKHIDTWKDAVADWRTTWQAILDKITKEDWFSINNTDKEMILALDK